MMKQYNFKAPDDNMFRLWRAVFALVHADGNFSEDEKEYIKKIVDIFLFSFKQRRIINKDLKKKKDVVDLFNKIKTQDYKRQFFVIARTIVWCDGFLHEMELSAINRIVDNLGDKAQVFQNELRWLDRKPTIEVCSSHEALGGDVMEIVVGQMSAFYKEEII